MEAMEMREKARFYAGSALKLALGAATVVGGAYLISRIKEKQDSEVRLERIEQIIEEFKKETEEK